MKIDIGAGNIRHSGFITIDFDKNSAADHILDLEKDKLPFNDNSIEFVIAHHVLEHLGDGYFHCLQELYRVCKHGAVIDIRVPHPTHNTFLADPTHKRPITELGLQLFSKKFNQLCKQNKSPSSQLGDFYNVDFEILDYKYIPDDKFAIKASNMTFDQLTEYANEHINVISEIYIKLIVIKNAK